MRQAMRSMTGQAETNEQTRRRDLDGLYATIPGERIFFLFPFATHAFTIICCFNRSVGQEQRSGRAGKGGQALHAGLVW